MSYPQNWTTTKENGLQVETSLISPLGGTSSLLLSSGSNEWNMINSGARKSASVYLNASLHPRGFSDGRIRTLIRRNNNTDRDNAWGGIFIFSDSTEGIGTLASLGQNRYEITNKGNGNIKIIKYVNTSATTIATSGTSFLLNTIHSFQVRWERNNVQDTIRIRVSVGTGTNFGNLTQIINYLDDDSPLGIAETEGLFVQTATGTDIVSYTFDRTSVYQIIHL